MSATIKGQKFAQLSQQDPRLAAVIQTAATTAVRDTENALGDLPGEKKHELARDAALDALAKLLVASSPVFGAYAPMVAAGAGLIPYIDDAIIGVVEWFNFLGDFQHNAEGTP